MRISVILAPLSGQIDQNVAHRLLRLLVEDDSLDELGGFRGPESVHILCAVNRQELSAKLMARLCEAKVLGWTCCRLANTPSSKLRQTNGPGLACEVVDAIAQF
jgi:hypothetical protein